MAAALVALFEVFIQTLLIQLVGREVISVTFAHFSFSLVEHGSSLISELLVVEQAVLPVPWAD